MISRMTSRTIQRSLAFVLVALACAAVCLATNLPSQWRSWRYSRPISIVAQNGRTSVTMYLPFDLLAHSDTHGSDLRIIDDRGQEVPYFLGALQSEFQTETIPSHLAERSFVPGQFTQIVIAVTDKPPLEERNGATLQQLQSERWFNTYRIVSPEADFMYWVETSVSDDAHQWRVVDPRSPISRFRKHGLDGNQTIQFEGYSNQRFLRLRIFDSERQFLVDSVEVLSRSSAEPPRVVIPAVFSSERSPDATESRMCADLGSPNLPVSEMDFATDQSEFYRAVRISTSDDGKDWRLAGTGEIYRFHQASKRKESLRVLFSETYAPFWCVDVVNGSDQPLVALGIDLRGVQRAITFQQEGDRSYKLIYGNFKSSPPQYDFAQIFDRKKVLPLADLGPEEVTTNYTDPRPYSERHPTLLWLVLVIAVAALAYTALKSLRTTSSTA
jgi:hypothetical protein